MQTFLEALDIFSGCLHGCEKGIQVDVDVSCCIELHIALVSHMPDCALFSLKVGTIIVDKSINNR